MFRTLLFLALLQNILSFSLEMKGRANTIAVFGGTGKLGREVVHQALQQGYKVVSLSRSGGPLLTPVGSCGGVEKPLENPNLTVLSGSVRNAEDVAKVFDHSDDISGVVITLGGRTKSVGKDMLSEGTSNIVDEMKKNGIKRVSLVTSIGTGDSMHQAPFFFKILMKTMMKKIIADKNKQEKIFLEGKGAGLEYCIIRPGGLGQGPPTGVVNVINGKAGSIQRADVASFCLGAVTDQSFKYIRKTPCISSVGGTGWAKEKGDGFDEATKI